MTDGIWLCIKCGYAMITHISLPPEKCPNCGAEYEYVKTLRAHMVHDVPVMRLKGTDKLAVVGPIAFLVGDPEDFREYMRIWREQERLAEEARRARVNKGTC